MSISTRELIEYNGIGYLDCDNIKNFNQENINFIFNIPSEKPDTNEILKVWSKAEIITYKIANTPKGISEEGQIITGNKMILIGDVEYKVEYTAKNQDESICTAYGKLPFSGFIALPKNITESNIINANAIIEEIYSRKIDDRRIYNNINLILIADIF